MASKSRKRSKRRVAVNRLDLIQRNFERGDFKQALKDARVCYREEATPQLRSLLEHVYLARAEQLSRQHLREDARRIVQELLDLGVTESSVQAGLPELLLSVGMLDRLPAGQESLSDDDRTRLQVKIVDQSVVRPQDAPQGDAELRENAERIRIALEAVERGDESAAAEQLNRIPRQSLFADWKFFTRGLMAYYREDTAVMSANWQRLDENRAAFKIAAPLQCLAGVASAPKGSPLADKVFKLQQQSATQRVVGPLKKLEVFTAKHQWRQAVKTLQTTASELRKQAPDSYRRAVAWLTNMLIYEGQVGAVDRLATFAEPMAIDPRWNRAKAAVRDHSDEWGAEQYWQKYLCDLQHVTAMSPPERDLVRAMVHLHLCEDDVDEALGLRNCGCGADHSAEIDEAETSVLEHFRQSLELAPAYQPSYARLAEFHEKSNRPEAAAEVHRRWLEQKPNDADVLLQLANHYLTFDQPLEAREFVERARQAKPLDKTIGDLLWLIHAKCARHLACQGEFDQARDALAAADRLQPNRTNDYDVLARRAVLEIKAGRSDVARTYLEEAQEKLNEPTVLWLVMTIESIRFDLPDKETWLYEKRWHTALKRRCSGETAGRMCKLLDPYLRMPNPYKGRDDHSQVLVKYLRRCSRVKWQAEDLRHVCDFLCAAKDLQLLAKFVKRGLKKFPQEAFVHSCAAFVEIGKGVWGCNRDKTLMHATEAIRLGEVSDNPADKDVVEAAKRIQAMLNELHVGYDDDYCDDEDDFDGDFDGDGDGDGEYDNMFETLEGVPPEFMRAMILSFCKREGMEPGPIMAAFERYLAARKRKRK